MKNVITKHGYIRDVIMDDKAVVTFKTYNTRKQSLTVYGKKTIRWIKDRFCYNFVALYYFENGKCTLIAEVK